jgi:hypothetical protein
MNKEFKVTEKDKVELTMCMTHCEHILLGRTDTLMGTRPEQNSYYVFTLGDF